MLSSILIMSFNANLSPKLESSHFTGFCEISSFLSFWTPTRNWENFIHIKEASPWCRCCRLKAQCWRYGGTDIQIVVGPIFILWWDRYSGTLSINSLCRCPRLKPGLIIAPSLPHSIMNNHIKTKHKGWTTKASSSCLTKPVKIHLSRYIILVLPPNPADQSDPIDKGGVKNVPLRKFKKNISPLD